MLNVFVCPNCGKKLKTDQGVGQTIPCPYCEEPFEISREHAAAKNELLFKLAIPIGYVLFVAVPLGLTIWYLTTRTEKPKEAVEATPAPVQVNRNDPKPPAPRPVVRPRKDGKPKADVDPEDDPEPVLPPKPEPPAPAKPKAEESPKPEPPAPPVEKTELAVAPEPRELPEVFVAPEPREIVWKLPPLNFATPWQKVGAVDLRAAGVAVVRVPIIDGKERVRDSAQPMLVVVIEVRMNTSTKKRELQSWTHGQKRYMVGFLAGGKDLMHIDLPLGSKVHSGIPLRQPLPQDGEPVHDVMVFAVPPADAGELSLRLDAERFGESGDVWVKIPTAAWKK